MRHNRVHIISLYWLFFVDCIVGAEIQSLPASFFNRDNSTWLVTVPPEWNFATILEAANHFNLPYQATNVDGVYNLTNLTQPYPSAGVPYTVYVNGTYSAYASNALSYGLQEEFNSSKFPYSDQTWKLPVVCEWPISGMYNRLNRILYYVSLVFTLVVRHYEWLVAGALASATIYSGSAAIQPGLGSQTHTRTSHG
jgi:hypothetical protein